MNMYDCPAFYMVEGFLILAKTVLNDSTYISYSKALRFSVGFVSILDQTSVLSYRCRHMGDHILIPRLFFHQDCLQQHESDIIKMTAPPT